MYFQREAEKIEEFNEKMYHRIQLYHRFLTISASFYVKRILIIRQFN